MSLPEQVRLYSIFVEGGEDGLKNEKERTFCRPDVSRGTRL